MVSETCYGTLEIVGSTTTVGPECESAVSELTYELPSVTLNLLSLIKPLPATAAAALRDGVVHLFVCLSVSRQKGLGERGFSYRLRYTCLYQFPRRDN